jgi:RND superfamily putative drug exporter
VTLDAVIVRTLLVPALAALLGRWNWWMPESLGRVLGAPAAAATGAAE